MPIKRMYLPEELVVALEYKGFFFRYMQLQLNKAAPIGEYWELLNCTTAPVVLEDKAFGYDIAYRVIKRKLEPVKWNAKPQAKAWRVQKTAKPWFVKQRKDMRGAA